MNEERKPDKLPAIQMYPGDWLRDTVAGCSLGAQGLWWRIMILMHDSHPYGHLVENGKAMAPERVARRVGAGSLEEYKTLLQELFDAGVPSVTKEGILYSRRMVRDHAAREARAKMGRLGAKFGKKGGRFGKLGGRPISDLSDKMDSKTENPPIGGFEGGFKTPVETPVETRVETPVETGIETPQKPRPSSSFSSSVLKDSEVKKKSSVHVIDFKDFRAKNGADFSQAMTVENLKDQGSGKTEARGEGMSAGAGETIRAHPKRKKRPYWQAYLTQMREVLKEKMKSRYPLSQRDLGWLGYAYDKILPASAVACYELFWRTDKPWAGEIHGHDLATFISDPILRQIYADPERPALAAQFAAKMGIPYEELPGVRFRAQPRDENDADIQYMIERLVEFARSPQSRAFYLGKIKEHGLGAVEEVMGEVKMLDLEGRVDDRARCLTRALANLQKRRSQEPASAAPAQQNRGNFAPGALN